MASAQLGRALRETIHSSMSPNDLNIRHSEAAQDKRVRSLRALRNRFGVRPPSHSNDAQGGNDGRPRCSRLDESRDRPWLSLPPNARRLARPCFLQLLCTTSQRRRQTKVATFSRSSLNSCQLTGDPANSCVSKDGHTFHRSFL